MGSGRKLTLAHLQEAARLKGGECLSTEYHGLGAKHLWRCSSGHEWEAAAQDILRPDRRSWCSICFRMEQRRTTFDGLIALASIHGGTCLGLEDDLYPKVYRFRCALGHTWKTTANTVQSGKWCRRCGLASMAAKRMIPLQQLCEIASSRGGRCLSTESAEAHAILLWECAEGHRWNASITSIKHGKNWCDICSHLSTAAKLQLNIAIPQSLAQERGGKLLSTNYVNTRTLLHWQCNLGHKWHAVYNNVNNGQWCPVCSSGRGERMTRACFEYIFNQSFPNARPQWLRTRNSAGRLSIQHLDGFCKDLSLAFEYDGRQHEMLISRFNMTQSDLLVTIERDKRKDELCEKHNITLIRISEVAPLTEARILRSVVKAILANGLTAELVESLGITLPRKVSPTLRAAMYDASNNDTKPLFMPSISA